MADHPMDIARSLSDVRAARRLARKMMAALDQNAEAKAAERPSPHRTELTLKLSVIRAGTDHMGDKAINEALAARVLKELPLTLVDLIAAYTVREAELGRRLIVAAAEFGQPEKADA